jgi:hypothetical protein
MREELARARAVTGPPCPKRGHYLKAEHTHTRVYEASLQRLVMGWKRYGTHCQVSVCEVTDGDLLTNHPKIAKELNLSCAT